MSTVNYSLKHKGVRLISAENAWTKGKNGQLRLNPKYRIIGKMDTRLPNMIVTASDKKKPKYKGSTYDLNRTAKWTFEELLLYTIKNGKKKDVIPIEKYPDIPKPSGVEKKTFRKTLRGKPIQEKYLKKTKTRLNKWDMRKIIKK